MVIIMIALMVCCGGGNDGGVGMYHRDFQPAMIIILSSKCSPFFPRMFVVNARLVVTVITTEGGEVGGIRIDWIFKPSTKRLLPWEKCDLLECVVVLCCAYLGQPTYDGNFLSWVMTTSPPVIMLIYYV